MPNKAKVPLWARFLLIATLNLVILAGVFAVFLRMQLRPELESFVMARARERVASVTTSLRADLEGVPMSEWDEVLARYSKEYGLGFLLYRNTGEQLAGPPTSLPREVDVQMPRGGPPPPAAFNRPQFRRPSGPPAPPFLAITNSYPKYWLGVRMEVAGSNGEPMRTVLMLLSPDFFTNPFFFEMASWLAIAAVAILISALCWLPLVRNLNHSIGDMMRATAGIAEGKFHVGLKTQRHDELGLLGTSINRMANRLETLTEGRKRFLGDAAHELRSPIARMQLATEILQRDAQGTAQKYLDDLQEDILLMSRLTDELLQFAKAESPGPLHLEAINVAEAAAAAVRREAPGGPDIQIDVDPSIHVQADMEYLVRSLANILRNAVRYAADSGPIRVSAERQDEQVRIIVADSGPGVPDEALDKIFTPFYRLDDARDRRTGGTGLGLAIVRTCIEACGGTVECRNRRLSGLEVIIHLAAAHLPAA